MEKTAKVFGENLKALRISRGLTQDALSERLGVAVHTVQNWERSRRKPDMNAVYAISKTLECDPGRLLGTVPSEMQNTPPLSPIITEILLVLPALDKAQLQNLLSLAKLFRDGNALGLRKGDDLTKNKSKLG